MGWLYESGEEQKISTPFIINTFLKKQGLLLIDGDDRLPVLSYGLFLGNHISTSFKLRGRNHLNIR